LSTLTAWEERRGLSDRGEKFQRKFYKGDIIKPVPLKLCNSVKLVLYVKRVACPSHTRILAGKRARGKKGKREKGQEEKGEREI
jgi:hypothetical protein